MVSAAATTARTSRLRRLWARLWYGDPEYELADDYVNAKMPDVGELEPRRKVALDYAAQEYARHRTIARRARMLYVVLQTTTIVAAAVATIVTVAASAGTWTRAVPSAVAALAAAALASFRFEREWLRHRTASMHLKSERWAFVCGSGPYTDHRRGADPPALAEAITRFFNAVDRITREGFEESDARTAPDASEGEVTRISRSESP